MIKRVQKNTHLFDASHIRPDIAFGFPEVELLADVIAVRRDRVHRDVKNGGNFFCNFSF